MIEKDGSSLSLDGITTRVGNRHAFIDERVLELIVRETVEHGSVQFAKRELAQQMGCAEKSLDRAVRMLR